MTRQPKNLGELERQSYRSRWQDGLLDLTGGLGVLAVGGSWTCELFWGVGFIAPVLIVLWLLLRRRVVEPRIGKVRFRLERRESERSGIQGSLLFGVGLLAMVLVIQLFRMRSEGGVDAWVSDWIAALPSVLLALMALAAAALTGLGRFVAYAGVLLATATVATPLGMEPGAQMAISGAVITVVGLFLFARFLSGHPLPEATGETP